MNCTHYTRMMIDHDRSPHPDGAYNGWVNLPNGDIYVAQYINDDAPMAQIRGYRISRSDWCLWPAGESLPDFTGKDRQEALDAYLDKDPVTLYVAPYHEKTVDMTREILEKNG